MRLPGETTAYWLNERATTAAQIGFQAVRARGERLAARAATNPQIAQQLRSLRYVVAQHQLVQEVKDRRADIASDPMLAYGYGQKLVGLFVKKDPASPIEQHAIGAAGILIETGGVDATTARAVTESVLEQSAGEHK